MASPKPTSVYDHGRSELRDRVEVTRAATREKKRLGRRLRELRMAKGWTQARAAEEAGMHYVHVARIEAGGANVTLVTLVAIALAYGVDLAALFSSDAATSGG